MNISKNKIKAALNSMIEEYRRDIAHLRRVRILNPYKGDHIDKTASYHHMLIEAFKCGFAEIVSKEESNVLYMPFEQYLTQFKVESLDPPLKQITDISDVPTYIFQLRERLREAYIIGAQKGGRFVEDQKRLNDMVYMSEMCDEVLHLLQNVPPIAKDASPDSFKIRKPARWQPPSTELTDGFILKVPDIKKFTDSKTVKLSDEIRPELLSKPISEW